MATVPDSLGLKIAQSRSYFYTLGPKVGIIDILGALGIEPIHGCFYKLGGSSNKGFRAPSEGLWLDKRLVQTWYLDPYSMAVSISF